MIVLVMAEGRKNVGKDAETAAEGQGGCVPYSGRIGRCTFRWIYRRKDKKFKIAVEKPIVIIYNDFNALIYKSKTGGMKMELTYYRKGDYLFPNLTIESSENSIGK